MNTTRYVCSGDETAHTICAGCREWQEGVVRHLVSVATWDKWDAPWLHTLICRELRDAPQETGPA